MDPPTGDYSSGDRLEYRYAPQNRPDDAAIDADGDGRPEVLSLRFCCKDDSSNEKCQYHCREYWWRDGTIWRKGEASGAA